MFQDMYVRYNKFMSRQNKAHCQFNFVFSDYYKIKIFSFNLIYIEKGFHEMFLNSFIRNTSRFHKRIIKMCSEILILRAELLWMNRSEFPFYLIAWNFWLDNLLFRILFWMNNTIFKFIFYKVSPENVSDYWNADIKDHHDNLCCIYYAKKNPLV